MSDSNVTTTEYWRPIPLLKGLYEASNLGRIRKTPKCRKLRTTNFGYLCVSVRDSDRFCHIMSVHRLVADAFHGPRPYKLDINHKNGVKSDNTPDNLEYLSRSDNIKHAYKVLKRRSPWALRQCKISLRRADDIRAAYAERTTTREQFAKDRGLRVSYLKKIIGRAIRHKATCKSDA